MEEKKLLSDVKIPIILEKIFNLMFKIRDSFDISDFKTGRMSQSCNYFGFNIEYKYLSLFFGYFLPLWSFHKTPIFLQVRESYINDKKPLIIDFLRVNNFLHDQKHEYILPFKVDEFENWDNNLKSLLKDLKNYLQK